MPIIITDFDRYRQDNSELIALYGEPLIRQMLAAFPIVNRAGTSASADFELYFGKFGVITCLLETLTDEASLALTINSGIWEMLLATPQNQQNWLHFQQSLTNSSLPAPLKEAFNQLAHLLFNVAKFSSRNSRPALQSSLEQLPTKIFSRAHPPSTRVITSFQRYLTKHLTIFHANANSTVYIHTTSVNDYVEQYQQLKNNAEPYLSVNITIPQAFINAHTQADTIYQLIGSNFNHREAALAVAQVHTIECQHIENNRSWLVRSLRRFDFADWFATTRQKTLIHQRQLIIAKIASWSQSEQEVAYSKATALSTPDTTIAIPNPQLNLSSATSVANTVSHAANANQRAVLKKFIDAEKAAVENLSQSSAANKKRKLAATLAFGEDINLMPYIAVTTEGEGLCRKTTGTMTYRDLNANFGFTPRTSTIYSLAFIADITRRRLRDPLDRGEFVTTTFTSDNIDLLALNQWLNLRRLHEQGTLTDPAANPVQLLPLAPFITTALEQSEFQLFAISNGTSKSPFDTKRRNKL